MPRLEDFSQWFYPGSRRVFTPEEMARGGTQLWPSGIDQYVFVNVVLLLAAFSHQMSKGTRPVAWFLALFVTSIALGVARWLWRRPSRRWLNIACYGLALVVTAALIVLAKTGWREVAIDHAALAVVVMTAILSAWWGLTVYRVDQIEARLRELADQDAALRLSTRLAAAQIQPHFLFNTLASLQHWVDTGDPRAAPLLRDFTAYLRATLPMFERELQPLADEIEMVRRYLAIMQARLGERLRVDIAMAPDIDAQLPPGLVLTLVENAIAHGVEPQLRGGSIDIAGHRDGNRLVLTVRDDGPGLAPGWTERVGLANTRRRLASAFPAATLTLADASPGCVATLTLPIPLTP
ncbi:sensor histidine kinase [Roseateles sp. LYH14W]|uniref:Sensor histidine kinase n=1 Tax=Pelomonas parva TaxID=3299032 RepID=A0ABW7F014_9BURK